MATSLCTFHLLGGSYKHITAAFEFKSKNINQNLRFNKDGFAQLKVFPTDLICQISQNHWERERPSEKLEHL